jgi:recombination protein RecT
MTGPELAAVAKQTAAQAGSATVKKFFEANKGTLLALLPKHFDAERMLKLALGALRTTPKLANASNASLLGAVVTCAQLGLEPNTPLGHA